MANTHNDEIDLTEISDNYLPRSTYKPGNESGDKTAFKTERKKNLKFNLTLENDYRHVNRKMVPTTGERTLAASILPHSSSHIHGVFSILFKNQKDLLAFNSACSSICFDFIIKVLPFINTGNYIDLIVQRHLRQTCLTLPYKNLWEESFTKEFTKDSFTKQIVTIDSELPWKELKKTWNKNTPLRAELSRRQALVEIDVLVALSLNLTLEELLTIYRIQFPVMRSYELADTYDQKGRHIPNSTRKNQGSKEFSAAYEKRQAEIAEGKATATDPLAVSWEIDNGLKTVTKTYYPPFFHVDREEDYRIAWQEFEKRSKE